MFATVLENKSSVLVLAVAVVAPGSDAARVPMKNARRFLRGAKCETEFFGEEECACCFGEFETDGEIVAYLPCRHRFHEKCILEWRDTCKLKKENFHCPTCRREVTSGKYAQEPYAPKNKARAAKIKTHPSPSAKVAPCSIEETKIGGSNSDALSKQSPKSKTEGELCNRGAPSGNHTPKLVPRRARKDSCWSIALECLGGPRAPSSYRWHILVQKIIQRAAFFIQERGRSPLERRWCTSEVEKALEEENYPYSFHDSIWYDDIRGELNKLLEKGMRLASSPESDTGYEYVRMENAAPQRCARLRAAVSRLCENAMGTICNGYKYRKQVAPL